MKTLPLLAGCCLALFNSSTLQAANPLVIHEWGTFTSLQDDKGHALGGINVDDEPAPAFVHHAGGISILSNKNNYGYFGLPPYSELAEEAGPLNFGDPAVTLRLETPVLYIYPPKGQSGLNVQVHVDFNGGILGQFYPYARIKGLPAARTGLTAKTVTSLDWKVVGFNWKQQPVATDDKVWTTPREVSAPTLAVDAPTWTEWTNGNSVNHDVEVEKFLFYRGVGHLDAPISISREASSNAGGEQLYLWPKGDSISLQASFAGGWLADIHADGTCAFRAVPAFHEGAVRDMHPMTSVSSNFATADFSAENLARLKASMQDELVKEGLYPDEASAMLRTWELSYFKSPGLRFFYTVPREWTDSVLPLKITGQTANITRVMVGRIELISDAQKATLARFSVGPAPDLAQFKQMAKDALDKSNFTPNQKFAYIKGEKPLTDLGVAIPPLLQDYLDLGRFRDALVVHEQQIHPSAALAKFIHDNGLAADTRLVQRE